MLRAVLAPADPVFAGDVGLSGPSEAGVEARARPALAEGLLLEEREPQRTTSG